MKKCSNHLNLIEIRPAVWQLFTFPFIGVQSDFTAEVNTNAENMV